MRVRSSLLGIRRSVAVAGCTPAHGGVERAASSDRFLSSKPMSTLMRFLSSGCSSLRPVSPLSSTSVLLPSSSHALELRGASNSSDKPSNSVATRATLAELRTASHQRAGPCASPRGVGAGEGAGDSPSMTASSSSSNPKSWARKENAGAFVGVVGHLLCWVTSHASRIFGGSMNVYASSCSVTASASISSSNSTSMSDDARVQDPREFSEHVETSVVHDEGVGEGGGRMIVAICGDGRSNVVQFCSGKHFWQPELSRSLQPAPMSWAAFNPWIHAARCSSVTAASWSFSSRVSTAKTNSLDDDNAAG
mmetsp:Transcript_70208/g.195385  ORF Transcript_70208/g.195385 Transcript_70208/m.195385 type:complete len:308 (-) Transcript_70208:411-1334(-)